MRKICKMYYEKHFDNKDYVSFALLQIQLMPIHVGLPSAATLLFNIPVKDLLSKVNMEPINYNINNEKYEALKLWQERCLKNNDTHRDSIFFL